MELESLIELKSLGVVYSLYQRQGQAPRQGRNSEEIQ